jgi:hypothetical protein
LKNEVKPIAKELTGNPKNEHEKHQNKSTIQNISKTKFKK